MKKELRNKKRVDISGVGDSLQSFNGDIKIEINNDNENLNSNEKFNPVNVESLEILTERKSINNKIGIEGELLISNSNRTEVFVDISGDILISDEFAENYEINENGELIYTK